ncbi:MAG TPA: alpha/beta fold hydrolase [Blastocatellia bacterium]|jgi:predicted alpha/beta-fold hydrolase|nr:alpha/beta fold hydrolase [Blastocatellia bacterium]
MTKENILKQLSGTPFVPHPAMKNAHAQTIMGALIRRRFKLVAENTEARFFDVAPGVRVLAHCSWQVERAAKPTLIIAHGMEGSSESRYMLGTTEKALGAGFNVVRLNHRNCGGTEHLTPTLYHAGLTDDIRRIIDELIDRDKLAEIYLAGFSLGGNIVLKLAGEYGRRIPGAVRGVVAVSPSIDLASCADAIEMRSNVVYNWNFLLSLRSRLRRKAELFPDRYDTSRLRGVWSIREFDDVYTAPHAGFRNVAHYYERASALPFISRIAAPTLIIHAKDDPFVPFAPFERPEVTSNPNVALLATEHGGHVGFISGRAEGENRFWAEVMVVEFARLIGGREAPV